MLDRLEAFCDIYGIWHSDLYFAFYQLQIRDIDEGQEQVTDLGGISKNVDRSTMISTACKP